MFQPDSNQDPEKGKFAEEDPLSQLQIQEETDLGDSSEPLFAMYSKVAEDQDKKMAERWQKDADGIIIFTGLFSAVVAALIVLSVQDLKPNSQDTSAFYLEHIYQLLADPNVTRPFISSVAKPPPFSPPGYALWVNSLWFLSLVISLSCAMLATSLEQWARRYLRLTQPGRDTPQVRARSRAFFAKGVDKFRLPWAVEVLPALVHLSLFLFFAGLLVYLFHTNHTVFTTVVGWVAFLTTAYGCITLMPAFRHDSPYYVSLSSIVWFFYASARYLIRKVYPFTRSNSSASAGIPPQRMSYSEWMLGGVERAAENAASERSSDIDARILEMTIDGLGDDDALEKFFEYIPAFRETDTFNDLSQSLPVGVQWKIVDVLAEFLRRTLSSDSVPVPVKSRRLAVCLAAVCEVSSSLGAQAMIDSISNMIKRKRLGVSDLVETGHVLRSWDKSENEQFIQCRLALIALIIASAQERNDHWTALVMDHLAVSEGTFQHYLKDENSVLLANLNHFIRQFTLPNHDIYNVLSSLSKFDIHRTHLRLQHEFCSLWNELVREARNSDKPEYGRSIRVLRVVCIIYYNLHSGAPSAFADPTKYYYDGALRHPSSFPLCNDPTHRLESMQDSVPADFAPPSSPLSHREGASPYPADVPSLDDPAIPIISSSHPASQVPQPNPATLIDYPADVPSLDDPAIPIINSSHPASQVPQPNPATLIDSAVITSAQATADRPAILSTLSAPPSTSTATVPNLQPAFTVTGISSSSSPPTVPTDTLPMDLHSFPTSSSQANRRPPSQELPPDSHHDSQTGYT